MVLVFGVRAHCERSRPRTCGATGLVRGLGVAVFSQRLFTASASGRSSRSTRRRCARWSLGACAAAPRGSSLDRRSRSRFANPGVVPLGGISTWQPRRSRDPSTDYSRCRRGTAAPSRRRAARQNIHVAAAASCRSAEYPRGSRGGAATCPRTIHVGLSTWQSRRCGFHERALGVRVRVVWAARCAAVMPREAWPRCAPPRQRRGRSRLDRRTGFSVGAPGGSKNCAVGARTAQRRGRDAVCRGKALVAICDEPQPSRGDAALSRRPSAVTEKIISRAAQQAGWVQTLGRATAAS